MIKYTLPLTTELLLYISVNIALNSYLFSINALECFDLGFFINCCKNIHKIIWIVFDDTSLSVNVYINIDIGIFYMNISRKVWFKEIMWWIVHIMLALKPSFFVELKQLIITRIVSICEKFSPTRCACAVMF